MGEGGIALAESDFGVNDGGPAVGAANFGGFDGISQRSAGLLFFAKMKKSAGDGRVVGDQ